MSDRAFGVEFEFSANTQSHQAGNGKKHIIPTTDEYGGRPSKYEGMRSLLSYNGFGDFSVGGDGSEFEVRTSILSGEEGFGRMKDFLSLMDEYGAHCYINSDGTHVHHDAPEFRTDTSLVLRLVETWLENQEEIHKLVDPIRYAKGACPLWSTQNYRELRRRIKEEPTHIGWDGLGRKNLNINALREHGTIELRLHEGTVNYEEISSWIKFGQAMLDSVVELGNIVPKHSNVEGYMKRINVERNASRFLSMKKKRLYAA